MLSLKSVLAGFGALLAFYIAVLFYKIAGYSMSGIATGPAVLTSDAIALLTRPLFWLAAVAVFLAAAFWFKK